MDLYSIKKGERKFYGKKDGKIFYQICFLILMSITAVVLSSFSIAFIVLLAILFFSIRNHSEQETQSIRVYFSAQCSYQIGDGGINPIYGFSNGPMKWNSAFIGWRGIGNDNVEIVAVSYVNGKIIVKSLFFCKTQNWIFLNIQNKTGGYVFKAMNHKGKFMNAIIKKGSFLSIYTLFKLFIFRLYPQIASEAKVDMKIYIKKVISNER